MAAGEASSSASTGSYWDQYVRWISGVFHGDFGQLATCTQQPVWTIMRTALPITIELVFLGDLDRAR